MRINTQGFFWVLIIICLESIFPILSLNFEQNILYAQNTKYPYKRYEDRKEGITKPRKLVAGDEKLELISALIENDESEPQEESQWYKLGFYLPNTARVKIVVNQIEKSYKMEPSKRDYSSGTYRFSWPSEIAKYYNIALHELLPF